MQRAEPSMLSAARSRISVKSVLPALLAAAASSATATATVASAAAPGTRLTGTSLVHLDLTAIDLFTVEGGDGRLPIFVGVHFDERKAARTTGVTIGHDVNLTD